MLPSEHTRTTPARRVVLIGRFPGTSQQRLAQRLAVLEPPVEVVEGVTDDVDAVFQGTRPSPAQRAEVVARGVPVYDAQALRDLLDGAAWDDVVRVLDGPDGARPVNAVLADLRAAFAEPPSPETWRRAREALQACPRDQLDLALDYALPASDAWDDLDADLTVDDAPRPALVPSPMDSPTCPTPPRWYYALVAGLPDPRLRMIRHLKLRELVEGRAYDAVYSRRKVKPRHALDALNDAGVDRVRWLDASALKHARFMTWPVHGVQTFLERQQRLMGVNLSINGLGQVQAKLWLPEPLLANLQALDLSASSLGHVASEYIASRAPALRWLALRGCGLSPRALGCWASGLDLSRLVALDLSDDTHEIEALQAMLAAPMERLRCLDLSTRHHARATAALAPLGPMPSLQLLGLGRWFVRGGDVAAITRGARLEVLDLHGAALDDVDALVRAPSLASLRVLRLGMMRPHRGLLDVLQAAARREAFPLLEALHLDSPGMVDPAVVRALDACAHWQAPALVRLREHLHRLQHSARPARG